jgi:hypothetical protein
VWTIKKITEIERMREISNHHQHGMEDWPGDALRKPTEMLV